MKERNVAMSVVHSCYVVSYMHPNTNVSSDHFPRVNTKFETSCKCSKAVLSTKDLARGDPKPHTEMSTRNFARSETEFDMIHANATSSKPVHNKFDSLHAYKARLLSTNHTAGVTKQF